MSDFRDLATLRDRLRSAKTNVRRVVMSEMDKAADDVKMKMRELAPVDTGNLRDSIRVIKIAGTYEIGPINVPYARAQEYGAKPHVIVAAPGKVLVFRVGGQTRYATKVNHPGNKAQPYIRPAGDWAKANLPQNIGVAAASLLKGK